jgi:hypothetical protein
MSGEWMSYRAREPPGHTRTPQRDAQAARRSASVDSCIKRPSLRRDRRVPPRPPLTASDVLPDTITIAGPDVPRDQWKAFYLKAIADLKPGLTEIIVHLGRDDAELQAVTVNHEPYGSAWRQRDYEVVTSPEFIQALRDNHVILVRWRDLQKLAQQP